MKCLVNGSYQSWKFSFDISKYFILKTDFDVLL